MKNNRMPGHEKLELKLPKKCVYAFLGEDIDKFAKESHAVEVEKFDSITKLFPIDEGWKRL